MKKLILSTLCLILLSGFSVCANELYFEPVGGGKFIYCNNPEGIEDDMLLNGEIPQWIMNNEALSTDKYYIYLSHCNYTGDESRGYDIELDMQMLAREDSKITIHKAFFETPETYAYYENGSLTLAETDWGQLQVCANMLGIPMCDIRGDDFYYPTDFEQVTLEVSEGESVWLSEYMNDYKVVNFGKPVHIQALVEIESGVMDFNVGAIKSGEQLKIRDHLPQNARFGDYRWDYTLKGMADTLPEVKTNIEYTIDETTKNGTKIPLFLKNQYIPEGHTVTEWYTQLNPQNDIWSKTTAAESDIIPLFYKDDAKLSFYGVGVKEEQKNNIWQFDTLHSAVRMYESRFNAGDASSFIPNFKLTTDRDNHTYACNIGNYGVATTYHMNIINNTDEVRYCTLAITAASEIIAYETDSSGTRSYAYVKDLTGEKVTDNMLSHKILPNTTESFEFSIILPVNFNGGIKNELIITDNNIQAIDFTEKKANVESEHKLSNYHIAKPINGINLSDIYSALPESSAQVLSRGGYEYLEGKDTALVRWCAWDGAPDWYYRLWGHVNTAYIFDENYNIAGSHEFSSLPIGASYNDGYFYIKTARDGVYKSADGIQWERTDEELPDYIPYYNLETASKWAISYLERGWDDGIRLEYGEDGYGFGEGITRGDFCKLASSFLDKVGIEESAEQSFTDTTDPHIERLASAGIVKGFGDGSFRPDDLLIREQAATILSRLMTLYIDRNDIKDFKIDSSDYVYADSEYISAWATDAVKTMHDTKIMNGTGNDKFDPHGVYTREQSVVTVMRLYDFIIAER